MRQASLTDIEYGLRKRVKREEFPKAMDEFIPWDEWVAYIDPITRAVSGGVLLWALKRCSVCICCNAGSTSLMRASKMPFTIVMPCARS